MKKLKFIYYKYIDLIANVILFILIVVLAVGELIKYIRTPDKINWIDLVTILGTVLGAIGIWASIKSCVSYSTFKTSLLEIKKLESLLESKQKFKTIQADLSFLSVICDTKKNTPLSQLSETDKNNFSDRTKKIQNALTTLISIEELKKDYDRILNQKITSGQNLTGVVNSMDPTVFEIYKPISTKVENIDFLLKKWTKEMKDEIPDSIFSLIIKYGNKDLLKKLEEDND